MGDCQMGSMRLLRKKVFPKSLWRLMCLQCFNITAEASVVIYGLPLSSPKIFFTGIRNSEEIILF